jgi:maltose-binding protein MalE
MNFSKYFNFKGIVFGIGIFAVIIAILGFSGKLPIFNSKSEQKLTGNILVWGTIPASNMSDFVGIFNKEAKTYTMTYKEVSYIDINNKLIQALADGVAPDLILAPSDIAFANMGRVFPVSSASISESSFRNTFIDMSSLLISMPYGYIGLPISVDPLILYYNRDILSSNGFLEAPKTWSELYKYEEKITKTNAGGDISLSTIAFGTYDNIPHISDILLTLIMQQGQTPVVQSVGRDTDGNSVFVYNVLTDQSASESGLSPLNSALAFTKDFSDTQKSTYNWNAKSKNALNEFIAGNLAFYIGYASEASYIKSANQKLYFDYTYVPQVDGSKTAATFGKLYTIFMLRTSPNQNLAYQVMIALATGPLSQNLVAMTGGVSALKANISSAISSGDQGAEVFGNSALISKNFYDLHREDLERLMREAIRQVYNGEKSTVEASSEFTENLQAVYTGE